MPLCVIIWKIIGVKASFLYFCGKIKGFMANPYFKFKQFTVRHDCCAMKVGTDAVLLGGWVRVEKAKKLLDVGCGSGVIALMAAQRSDGDVYAIEIDKDAAGQAKENVRNSPWNERITVLNEDFKSFSVDIKFDAIFSNPPYFVNSLKCPDQQRASARHTDKFNFEDLIGRVVDLLAPKGEFSVVIPMNSVDSFKAIASSCLLYLLRETWVYTNRNKAEPKRALLAFGLQPVSSVEFNRLVIEEARGVYSKDFYNMVKDFYL